MSTPIRTEPDIHDMVNELTARHTQREPYAARRDGTTWTAQHPVDAPALVHQLLGATPSGAGSMSGTTPVSKPAARIESIDTLMLIDDEAAMWIRRLGGDVPGDVWDRRSDRPVGGSGTIARIRRLHGLHASAETCTRRKGRRNDEGTWCCTAHHIEHDVRRWWHQARIITRWDSAPYRPFSTCPVCEHRGGLRINLELQAGFCVECRAVWPREQIGLLADHIRTENGSDTPVEASG